MTFQHCRVHTLSGRIGKVVASHAEDCKVARSNPGCGIRSCTAGRRSAGTAADLFILYMRRSAGTAVRVGDATSQLDLPTLTPLSVAGCG